MPPALSQPLPPADLRNAESRMRHPPACAKHYTDVQACPGRIPRSPPATTPLRCRPRKGMSDVPRHHWDRLPRAQPSLSDHNVGERLPEHAQGHENVAEEPPSCVDLSNSQAAIACGRGPGPHLQLRADPNTFSGPPKREVLASAADGRGAEMETVTGASVCRTLEAEGVPCGVAARRWRRASASPARAAALRW